MEALNQPPKYSPEQASEIVNRIVSLRLRWLRHVESQLASRQTAMKTTFLSGKDQETGE